MINKNHYLSVYKCLLFCLALGSASLTSCKKNKDIPKEDPKPVTTETGLKIYKPKDMANMDWNSEESQFCYARSKQSDHYIIFWSKEYGKVNPSDASVPDKYRVDIDAMLSKAEGFYQLNVNQLKFADLNLSTSNLHKYKMMIFLYHQDDWLATGSGYDDIIGSLWVSPAACQPVGATIAHEVGHTFQYMVSVDLGLTHGFRYGYGGKGGNTFWEQCAQWQAYQSYPSEVFGGWLNGYTDNYYKHILHEDYRYSSYFIHYYWTQKHGIDFIGKLWRQSQQPEDAIQAYQRITNISQDQFNDEIYDASAKLVTWDLDALRDMGANYIGKHISKMNRQSDGSFQPDYNFCPQTTGYNVIPLNVPAAGTVVSATFKGMANASGYNKVDASIAGWRYGYVALLKDGKRVYSNVYKNANDVASFTVPANCDKLWMVVTGAPKVYNQHAWDEDNTNDEQWPYNVTFQNTNVYGYLNNNPGAQPTNVDFSYDVSVKQDNANYTSTPVSIELSKLTNAFVLQPDELTAKMGTAIKFYAIESNGTLNATTTANGYGHWFSAAGNVVTWGPTAVVYSEYNEKNYTFTLGQYPGHNKVGDKYTVKQALVYTTSNNTTVKATFTFNITLIQ